MTRRRGAHVAVAAAIAGAALLVPGASAQSIVGELAVGGDFATTNDQWNGTSGLLEVGREQDAEVEVVTRLDLGTLTPADGLLVLYPTEEMPAGELSAFMRAGGRVALADDYGAGDSLLGLFRIGRADPNADATDVLRLRGNRALLVARPESPHPLGDGVSSLVTNHPRVLFHADLEPIFTLGAGQAVVLAGAVGQGRFVAIGDPSIFINNMLQLDGNRRFASNLLLYLRGSGSGRVLVVEPGGRIVGRYGEPGADRPLHDLRALLERAAALALPAPALRILALAVAVILVLLVAGVVPRTSPYQATAMFREELVPGGLWGRVEWYRARSSDLLEPTLVYKLELEAALAARLGIRIGGPGARGDAARRTHAQEMIDAMRARGMTSSEIDDARRLLDELAGLASGATNGTAPPVPEARFRSIVARGEALLKAASPDTGGRA